MYPKSDVELNAELPGAAEFWTPEPDDISEEGFGYFDEVWPIVEVSEDEAREMLRKDEAASSFVSDLASTDAEFDATARVIETGVADYAEDLSAHARAVLGPHIAEAEEHGVPLDGLDVGVAGLVYALSAAGAYPAASCRGQHQYQSWSDVPVVFFATDRCRADVLAPLVKDAGCGFDIDPARPELLVVYSTSVEGTIALAGAVIGKLQEFRACDESNPLPSNGAVQSTLFDGES